MPRKTKIQIFKNKNKAGIPSYFISINKVLGIYIIPQVDQSTKYEIVSHVPHLHEEFGWTLEAEN